MTELKSTIHQKPFCAKIVFTSETFQHMHVHVHQNKFRKLLKLIIHNPNRVTATLCLNVFSSQTDKHVCRYKRSLCVALSARADDIVANTSNWIRTQPKCVYECRSVIEAFAQLLY